METTEPHPHTSYMVCGANRGGTGLLCEALRITGLAGVPTEHFTRRGPEKWGRIWSEPSTYPEYLYAALRHGTTPNGVFGTKMMWSAFQRFLVVLSLSQGVRVTGRSLWAGSKGPRARAELYLILASHAWRYPFLEPVRAADFMARTFPGLKYIWITRRDKVAQAVSAWKLNQTGRAWKFKGEDDAPPAQLEFDFKQIDRLVGYFTAEDRGWRAYFDEFNIVPHHVVYEDFVETYVQTARRLLEYLEIPVPSVVTFGARHLEKQADAVSAGWIERYHAMKDQRDRGRP